MFATLRQVLAVTTMYTWYDAFYDMKHFRSCYVVRSEKYSTFDFQLESFVQSYWNFLTDLTNV